MRPDELDRRLRELLDALPPAARAELLYVLMLPDFERADRIGEFWGYPESRIECDQIRLLLELMLTDAPFDSPASTVRTRCRVKVQTALLVRQ